MDDDAYGKKKLSNFKKRSRNQFDNGKQKRQNQNPTSDQNAPPASKAIETLYRILCPVKKIGSVLGKGGDIVNAIRNKTNAKIRVADAIPRAEERVIIIFNHPSRQSERSDGYPDHESKFEDMRPHCPAQDALMKVHDRIASDEYVRDGVVLEKSDADDSVIARMLVPSNQVGCLMGKGGTVIQKLRSDHSGAGIRVLPRENLPPCAMSTDELVQISGAPAVVKKALYDISTRLHQHPRKENPSIDDLIYASTQGLLQPGPIPLPPPHGNPMRSHHQPDAYTTPPAWAGGYRSESFGFPPSNFASAFIGNDDETPAEFSIRILCPTGRIGGVIGKSGATVRQLEHQTRAKIQVEETNPEAEERIINVSSREGPQDPISPTIEALLQLQSRTCVAAEDGTVTTRLLVPSGKVGCLLGQGGNVISEMRKRTRADIKVHSKGEKPNYAPANQELVQISGNHEVARDALLEIASRLRTRTFRIANVGLNPEPMYPDRGFAPPPERISGREFAPPSMIGPAGNPPPVYPARGFHAPPEDISNRGPPSSSMIRRTPPSSMFRDPPSSMFRTDDTVGYEYPKGPPRPAYESQGYSYETQSYSYEAQGYPSGPPPATTRYPSLSNTMEIKIPNSAVSSVVGVGGSNISEIRQISGARVIVLDPLPGSSERVVEIHGSSEQLKAAQSLLQAFVASGDHSGPQMMPPAPYHRPY